MSNEPKNSKHAINTFKDFLKNSYSPRITINTSVNPALYPLHAHIIFTFEPHWSGVLIADTQGVYTPIQEYKGDIIHLMRLPKLNVPVYAVSDLRSIVYTEYNNLIIVYQGVYKNVNGHYDFISREYYIRPVPGISFEKHLLVQHVIKKDRFEVAVIDTSDDDDFYEDDGLD